MLGGAARIVAWCKPPSFIPGKSDNGNDTWFSDGELNSSYLALGYHVEQGCEDQAALTYD